MSIVVSLGLCLSVVFVPCQAESGNKIFTQMNDIVSHVNTGFKSIATVLRRMKVKADEVQGRLSKIEDTIKRLDLNLLDIPDSVKLWMVRLNVSVADLVAIEKLKSKIKECDKGWTPRGAKCYLFVRCSNTYRCNSNTLRDQCRKHGSQLASIRSAKENEFIASLSGRSNIQNVFIGGRDDVLEGRWLWPDDSLVSYTNWDENQPDNGGGNQNCMVMWLHRGKRWDDEFCIRQLNYRNSGYVCEKPMSPIP